MAGGTTKTVANDKGNGKCYVHHSQPHASGPPLQWPS